MTAYPIGSGWRLPRWGFVKVLYDDNLLPSQNVLRRAILAYGGGTYWDRTLDSVVDSDQVNSPYDEYDDGETLDYQFRQAMLAGQEPVLYANCLVPTPLRAAGATPGWPGTSIDAAPDQDNHQLVADYYAAVVDRYYSHGLRKVVVGGELRGMYSSDPGATPAIPDGWDIPRYWDLYEKTYDAIKAQHPDVLIYGPYAVFYDGTQYSEPNTTLGSSTEVATEVLDAITDFLDLALAAEKIDGFVFDGVIPTAGWPDVIDWVKLQIGTLPLIVAESYDSYTAPPTGPIGDEITTSLLNIIDAELREGDLAFIWCEPDFWANGTLVVPDSGDPLYKWPSGIGFNGLVIDGVPVGARNHENYVVVDEECINVTFDGRSV